QSNWKVSIATLGGTPGSVNSVNGSVSDLGKPYITSITIVENNVIEMEWNEDVDLAQLSDIANFSVDSSESGSSSNSDRSSSNKSSSKSGSKSGSSSDE
ncbi:MAG: hypothetical protein ACKO81_09415, partial [Planctomycetota bacterium]